MMTEGEVEDKRKKLQLTQSFDTPSMFQTDEEIIQELNKSTFLDKHQNCVPQMGAAQRYFDEQMASQSQWGQIITQTHI